MRRPTPQTVLMVFIALFMTGTVAAADDWQYWSRTTLDLWRKDRLKLSTQFETYVMEDVSEFKHYQLSQRLGYNWLDNVDLTAGYTYISSETSLRLMEEFRYQHRLELEINPHWEPIDRLRIKNRNRLEFRWIEEQGSDNARFRQRWEFIFPITGHLPWKSFYIDNEYFFDFKRGQINENRMTPVGFEFTLSDNSSLKLFYMLRARKGPQDWFSDQIIGTHLTYKFD